MIYRLQHYEHVDKARSDSLRESMGGRMSLKHKRMDRICICVGPMVDGNVEMTVRSTNQYRRKAKISLSRILVCCLSGAR